MIVPFENQGCHASFYISPFYIHEKFTRYLKYICVCVLYKDDSLKITLSGPKFQFSSVTEFWASLMTLVLIEEITTFVTA